MVADLATPHAKGVWRGWYTVHGDPPWEDRTSESFLIATPLRVIGPARPLRPGPKSRAPDHELQRWFWILGDDNGTQAWDSLRYIDLDHLPFEEVSQALSSCDIELVRDHCVAHEDCLSKPGWRQRGRDCWEQNHLGCGHALIDNAGDIIDPRWEKLVIIDALASYGLGAPIGDGTLRELRNIVTSVRAFPSGTLTDLLDAPVNAIGETAAKYGGMPEDLGDQYWRMSNEPAEEKQ